MSTPVFRAMADMDAELAELSRLHMAYENAHRADYGEWDIADELSAAVGKFLVTRGYEGRI